MLHGAGHVPAPQEIKGVCTQRPHLLKGAVRRIICKINSGGAKKKSKTVFIVVASARETVGTCGVETVGDFRPWAYCYIAKESDSASVSFALLRERIPFVRGAQSLVPPEHAEHKPPCSAATAPKFFVWRVRIDLLGRNYPCGLIRLPENFLLMKKVK